MSGGQGSAKESIQTVTKMLTATEPNDTSRLLSAIRALAGIAINGRYEEHDSGKPLVRTRNHAEIPLEKRLINILFGPLSDAGKICRMMQICSGADNADTEKE